MLPNAFLRVREMQRDKKRSPKASNSAPRFLHRSEVKSIETLRIFSKKNRENLGENNSSSDESIKIDGEAAEKRFHNLRILS